MYAIIQTGGKQYRVKKGDVIDVERLTGFAPGASYEFTSVLFLQDGSSSIVGTPVVPNARVKAEIIAETKGPKVIAFKYKRRKDSRITKGHRQKYARVKITEIVK